MKSILFVICYFVAIKFAVATDIMEHFQGQLDISTSVSSWNTPDINANPQNGNFILNKKKSISFTYTSDYIWLRFKLTNKATKPQKIILYMNTALSGSVDLYIENEQVELLAKGGSSIPYNKRSIISPYMAHEITLPPGIEKTFYLKRHGVHQFNGHLFISDEKTFTQVTTTHLMVLYLYLGVFSALFFYNVFIAIFTRSKDYFLYSGFVFSLGGVVLNLNGGMDLLFPNLPISDFLMLFSSSSVIFSIAFTNNFLNVRDYFPRFQYLCRAIIIAGILHFILYPIIWKNYFAILGFTIDITIIINVLAMITIGILTMLRGNILSRFYVLSWSGLVISVILWMGMTYKIFPKTTFFEYSILWGSIFEMLVISFGLAYRIVVLKKSKEQALFKVKEQQKYRYLLRVLMHDIGNPLNLVVNFNQLAKDHLKKSQESPEAIKYLDIVSRASNSIADIIHSIRTQELSKGSNEENLLEKVNLKEVIDDCNFLFKESLKEKNIRLFHPKTSCTVTANKSLLIHQVFSNILSNAIKFSPVNGAIDLKCDKTSTQKVIITIRDYGIGVSEQQVNEFTKTGKIFSTPGTLGELGNGYGMMVMKSTVEMLGGSVQIANTKEKFGTEGTIVTLTLNV